MHLGRRLTLVAWKGGGGCIEAIAARERMCVKEEKGFSAIAFVDGRDLVVPGRRREYANCQATGPQGQAYRACITGSRQYSTELVPSTLDLTCQNTARYCWKWPLPAADPRPRGKA